MSSTVAHDIEGVWRIYNRRRGKLTVWLSFPMVAFPVHLVVISRDDYKEYIKERRLRVDFDLLRAAYVISQDRRFALLVSLKERT